MTSSEAYKQTLTLTNTHGIHVRTAALIAECCGAYDAEITITSPHASSDGKDMMRLLLLQATCGTELLIESSGKDADQVMKELCDLIQNKFKLMDD